MEDTLTQVLEIVKNQLGLDEVSVDVNIIEEYDATTVDLDEMSMDIEDHFDISFSDADYQSFVDAEDVSINKIVELVNKYL